MLAKKNKTRLKLGAGMHLVKISEVKIATKEGKAVKDPEGYYYLIIKFETVKGYSIKIKVSLNPKNRWFYSRLVEVIGIDPSTADINNMLKKRLYIVVSEEHHYYDGKPKHDETGSPIIFYKVEPLFFKYDPKVKPPELPGDPRRQGGEIGGNFLKIKEVL